MFPELISRSVDATRDTLMRMLDETTTARFRNDGVVCIRNAISPEWLQLLQTGVDQVIEAPQDQCASCDIPSASGRFFNGFFQSLANEAVSRFIRTSPVKDFARSALNSSRIRFFYDQLLAKSPRTGQRTPWHSDRDYFPLTGKQIASVWIPLDAANADTGTLEFIRGSHIASAQELIARCPQQQSVDQDKGMYVLPDFERYPDLYDIVSWEMQPGDILIFHIDMLHSGGANRSSKQWRRALATRWLGDDVAVAETGPHILQKPEITNFLNSQGLPWRGRLDDRLFPVL